MPDWLDAEGKRCWRSVTGSLAKLGTLKQTDGEPLAMLCNEWSAYVRATKKLHGFQGEYTERRALAGERNEALRNYKGLCLEFGQTPSSRTRIDVKTVDAKQDEFEKFLASKGRA